MNLTSNSIEDGADMFFYAPWCKKRHSEFCLLPHWANVE